MPISFKELQKISFTNEMTEQLISMRDELDKLGQNCKWYQGLADIGDKLTGLPLNTSNLTPEFSNENKYNDSIKQFEILKQLLSADNFRKMLNNKAFSEHFQIDVEKLLTDLEFFSDTYKLGLDIPVLRTVYTSYIEDLDALQDNAVNNKSDNANINNEIIINEKDARAEALKNKRISTKGKLDSFSDQLNKKHRIPFIGGGTSDELQTVKNAIELYKNFCDDPNNPEFTGLTETSLLKSIKKAAEEYIEKKKENRWKDTTREDWTPNTRMGTERYLGVKGVLKTATDRIKEIEDDEREYVYSLQRNDRIHEQQKKEQKKLDQLGGTIADLIEDSFYDTDYSKLSDDKLMDEFASFTAWAALNKDHGDNAIARDHKAEHDTLCEKYKNDKYFNGFFNKWKAQIKNRTLLSADSSIIEKLEKYTTLSKQTEAFSKKFGEGSFGAFIANTRFDILSNDLKYNDEVLKDLLAAEMICHEKGFDTAFDKNELDNTKKIINEAAFDRFIESLSRAQKIGLVNAPDDLLNEYSKSLSITVNKQAQKAPVEEKKVYNINEIDEEEPEKVINGDEQLPDPENIEYDLDYQEEEPDIYSEVEYDPDDPIPGSIIPYQNNIRRAIKGDKSFEDTKAAVKESIAGILSTKALWSKPEKQPISVITTNMNNDEDVERYLSDNSKKCEMRDSGIKQLMAKNKELDFMFSGINTAEQLKELSEKALYNDASELMIEQKKAADKLAGINGNISKTEPKDNTIKNDLNK